VKPPNINSFVSDIIIRALVEYGVGLFCISPGSRSTPLTLAAANRSGIDVHIVHDERASAYFAVGYARACGRPAAVICTSGTAVANLLPAVVEAYQSRLPLILLTADRPEELQNCGANQVIDQKNIFGKFVADSITIPAPDDTTDPYSLLDKISRALDAGQATPIHINCRFREPLAPVEQIFDLHKMQASSDKWYTEHKGDASSKAHAVSDDDIDYLAHAMNERRKCLIIVGPEASWRQAAKIAELSEKLHARVITDVLANLVVVPSVHRLRHYDLYLDIDELADDLAPDLVIHFGGLPISKRLNQFLARHREIDYIKIQDHNRTIDPDLLETHRIVGPPDDIIRRLLPELKDSAASEYHQTWRTIDEHTSRFLHGYFVIGKLTECSLPFMMSSLIEEGEALYLSNSMPVRDADTFFASSSHNVATGANRGASGIDGTIASACGFARGIGKPTTLIIGDVAFLHDLNSLAIAAKSAPPVIIILVNNDGGGIFHFLPVANATHHFEKFFATPHGLHFGKAAELFGLPYYHPAMPDDFAADYHKVRSAGRSALIEISGDRRENFEQHELIRSRLPAYLMTKRRSG